VSATVKGVTDEAASQLRQQAAGVVESVMPSLAQGSRQAQQALSEALARIAAAQDDAHRSLGAEVEEARRQLESELAGARARFADAARDQADATALGQERAALAAAEARAALERGIGDASRSAEALLAGLDGRLGSVHAWATTVVEEVENRLEDWRERANRIAAALGPADLALVTQLPALIERASAMRRQLEEAILGSADRIEGQAAALDRLSSLHDELRGAIAQATDRCEETVRTLRDLAGAGGPSAESIAGAAAQLDRAAAALAHSAEAARASAATATAVTARADEAAARLTDLLARLESWRPLLAPGQPTPGGILAPTGTKGGAGSGVGDRG